MSVNTRPPGKTTIAPGVLLTIARLATLEIDGVSHMSDIPGGVNKLLKPAYHNHGVSVELKDDQVYADLFIVLDSDVNIRETSRKVQQEVERAISEMVGMSVGHVNVHIEDITYSSPSLSEA